VSFKATVDSKKKFKTIVIEGNKDIQQMQNYRFIKEDKCKKPETKLSLVILRPSILCGVSSIRHIKLKGVK